MKPQPRVTLEQFGVVDDNDWPLVVPARYMLRGIVVRFWHRHHPGKAPRFCGRKSAEKALRRLHRLHAHEVTPEEAADALAQSYADSERARREFRLAVALDAAAGRACIRGDRLHVAGLGSATLRPAQGPR